MITKELVTLFQIKYFFHKEHKRVNNNFNHSKFKRMLKQINRIKYIVYIRKNDRKKRKNHKRILKKLIRKKLFN